MSENVNDSAWAAGLLDSAPCGFFRISDDGTILQANTTLRRLLEWDSTPLTGEPVTVLLSGGGRVFFQTHVLPSLQLRGQVEEISLTLRTRGGGRVPVLLNAVYRREECVSDCMVMRISRRVRFEEDLIQAKKDAQQANAALLANEELLRQSVERMRVATDVAGLVISEIDYAGNQHHLSAEGARLFGMGSEAMTVERAKIHALFHPEDAKELHERIAASLDPDGDGWFSMEHRILLPDGEMRWISVRKQVYFNRTVSPPLPLRGLMVVQEMTARRIAEEQLRGSESRSRVATEATGVGIWEWHLRTGRVHWDGPLFRIYGMEPTPDGIVHYDTWLQRVVPEDRTTAEEVIRDTLERRGSSKRRFRIHRQSDGVLRHIEATETVRLDEAGEVECLVGTNLDMTERTVAEIALAAREVFTRRVLDNLYAFVGVLNPDGTLIQANRAPLEAARVEAADVLGKKFWDCHWWNYSEELQDRMRDWCARAAAGEIVRADVPVLLAAEEPVWIDFQLAPLRDDAGRITHLIPSGMDISARREAELALRAAKEKADAASKAKDDFMATLSHELRTPLTPALLTVADLASDTSLPEEVRTRLAMVCQNINLEARLIDDLLDVTRITSGKLTIAPVDSDLNEILSRAREITGPEVAAKRQSLVYQLDATRRFAPVDPARMQQVFWNLLKNAVKFTPVGGTITLTTADEGENRIRITLADNGIGISAETLPFIFRAFEQGDAAGLHQFGGLGLGLAISRSIVDAHGGTLHAESDGSGRGARFVVSLESGDPPHNQAAPGIPAPTPDRLLRVLVVEDHEATRNSLYRLLSRRGCEVTTADCVARGLAEFTARGFDVVVSDLGLPDGTGLELMRKIQAIRPVPAVALSGYGMQEDLRQSREAGFTAHMVKPIRIEELRETLERITRTP